MEQGTSRVRSRRHRVEPQLNTLEEIRDAGAKFPHEALVGSETALLCFCAAFLGRQDAFWVADAGLKGTCVDVDQEKLDAMWAVYPEGWEFVCADAFEFAPETDRQWDVVTLDPYTQDFTRTADNLPVWCRLARHKVLLGTGIGTVVTPPPGWRMSEHMRRSDYDGGVYWTVLERV